MGLDIHLHGRIVPRIAPIGESYAPMLHSDGNEIDEIRVKLGYWRKDWNLQNHIAERHADIVQGENISFSANGLRELLGEIQSGALDRDGEDYSEEAFEHTVSTLQRAIEWVESAPDSEWRDVIYWASW